MPFPVFMRWRTTSSFHPNTPSTLDLGTPGSAVRAAPAAAPLALSQLLSLQGSSRPVTSLPLKLPGPMYQFWKRPQWPVPRKTTGPSDLSQEKLQLPNCSKAPHQPWHLLNLAGLHSFICEMWGWTSLLCSPNFSGWGGVGEWPWGPKEKSTKIVLGCWAVSCIPSLGMILEALWSQILSEGPKWEREDGAGARGIAQHGLPLALSSEAQLRFLLTADLGIP